MAEVIPEHIRLFILDYIGSVAQLEALLLCSANPEKEWAAMAIARELYISESEAGILLAKLTQQGFLIQGAQAAYRYAPQSPELNMMVREVATVYRQYLVPVTNLIHAKSRNRIQKFADAFKLRKDKE